MRLSTRATATKATAARHELSKGPAEGATAHDGHHHRQDHDPEDVVQHGGADHDLALPALEPAQLAKHAGGDADRGGRHRRPGEHRRNQGHMEE